MAASARAERPWSIAVQGLDGDGSEQLLLIGEVSVERRDPDAGTVGHGVSGWLASEFKYQVDRGVQDRLPVPSGVDAHRTAPPL